MNFSIEHEQEEDSRWLAEVPELPGVLAYGTHAEEAMLKVEALVFRIIAERLERIESRFISVHSLLISRILRSIKLLIITIKIIIFLVIIVLITSCQTANIDTHGEVSYTTNFIKIDLNKTIDQMWLSDMACGPAAVLNSMRFGPPEYQQLFDELPGNTGLEKLDYVVRVFGSKPSDDYESGTRIRSLGGMSADDLKHFYMDLLKGNKAIPTISGVYLDRLKFESDQHFVWRIHKFLTQSIKKGVPPIIHVWAVAPDFSGIKPLWGGIASHFITINLIQDQLDNEELGFYFKYIDPNGGTLRSGYLYAENRFSPGIKGNDEKFEWIKNPPSPFLSASVPSLFMPGMGKFPLFGRIVINVHYAIGVFLPE